jgi:hypothetical protein
VQVALVDGQPALDLAVLDPDHLDAAAAGEAARDPLAEQLGRHGLVRQALRSSAASPS